MTAEIYDFDNALYKDPVCKNAVFLQAAINAAKILKPSLSDTVIQTDAQRSFKQYGTDFAIFVEEHDISEADIHPLYHRLAMKKIFDAVEPDPNIIDHFQNRLSAKIPFSIVTHGSQEWLEYGLKKLGLYNLFDPRLLFAVDMPEINFQYKNQSLAPFNIVANAMEIPNLNNIRFFDDSRSNLQMAKTGGIETVLVHWGHDKPRPNDNEYIDRKVAKVNDYTI